MLLKIIYRYEYEYTKFLWILSMGVLLITRETFIDTSNNVPADDYAFLSKDILATSCPATFVMLFVASIKASLTNYYNQYHGEIRRMGKEFVEISEL